MIISVKLTFILLIVSFNNKPRGGRLAMLERSVDFISLKMDPNRENLYKVQVLVFNPFLLLVVIK